MRKVIQNPDAYDFDAYQVRDIVSLGGLIPDETAMQLIREKIEDSEEKRGVVIHGFPRTVNQLTLFTNEFKVNLVLNLHLRGDILFEKLLGRLACSSCGATYNVRNVKRYFSV